MFRGDECVEAGGGVWVCGNAPDEVWYKRIVELSVAGDHVVEDFLEPGVPQIHGNGEREESPSRLSTRVWRSVAVHVAPVHIRETPESQLVLPIYDPTGSSQLNIEQTATGRGNLSIVPGTRIIKTHCEVVVESKEGN